MSKNNSEEKYNILKTQNQELLDKNNNLIKSIESYTFETFDNDNKVQFCTGLPNANVLECVLDLVKDHIPGAYLNSKLTKKQEFIMVLIKLRLGLFEQDLAYIFCVSQSTVSRIFQKWITVMSVRLAFLVKWPDRDQLQKTMPSCFREHFPRCAVILDCFEIFIEKPSDLTARAQTFSSHKHHNTVKVLLGITPQGTISFVSKPWGGRVSDVYLTENCGILKKLLPHDVVLADRGFTIRDCVNLYCAELKIPEFTKGKNQLSKKDVDETREIAHVRIHVERVIGLMRNKYTILQQVLPIKMVMETDDGTCKLTNILTVCSALCNLCGPVVPID